MRQDRGPVSGCQLGVLPPWARYALQGLFFSLLAGAFTLVCTVPVKYPSTSLWYKFGTDKVLLQAGKMCGLLAGAAILLQLLLASRIKLLDRIFALNRLLSLHRALGILAASSAAVHPLLVIAPDGLSTLSLSAEYWPEGLGAVMLLTIWASAAAALRRDLLRIPYRVWKYGHRLTGALLAAALFVHVLFVSDSFESGLPRLVLMGCLILYASLWTWVRLKPLRLLRGTFTVASLASAGRNAFTVELQPQKGRSIRHAPGQFVFLRFKSRALSAEEHPFTIASAPQESGRLLFCIRCSGDWTARIGKLSPGELATVEGPYGLFSHLAWPGFREILMFAGGIGVTPMLSMLRYMAAAGETRPTTLVWSNRTREDIVCKQAFENIEESLQNFRLIHVLTRESVPGFEAGRLDRRMLERFLPAGEKRGVLAFICGPPAMIAGVRGHLRALGMPRGCIKTEVFSL